MAQVQSLAPVRGRVKLMNWKQVCDWLAISRSRFYQLKDEGAFGPVYVIGHSVRVTEKGVADFLKKCKDADIL